MLFSKFSPNLPAFLLSNWLLLSFCFLNSLSLAQSFLHANVVSLPSVSSQWKAAKGCAMLSDRTLLRDHLTAGSYTG